MRQGEEGSGWTLDHPSYAMQVAQTGNGDLPDWEWGLSYSCFQVVMASSRTSTAAFESLAFLATSRAGEERRGEERRGGFS